MSVRNPVCARSWATILIAAAAASGCGRPPNAEDTVVRAPETAAFPSVADALQPSCGTLDCHGRRERNRRLYGGRGLRLDPNANPADDSTTEQEYGASYRSIVGLEPELMDEVVRGRDPDALSLIRKARGAERHKGGTQMLRDDPLDRCLVSWLESHTEVDACLVVARAPRPEAPSP